MFPVNTILAWIINDYHEQGNIIKTNLLLPLGHISNSLPLQPEGFVDTKGVNKVCKLQRSIYGLVQASRSWNKRFDSVIKAFGFIQTFEKPVFTRK